MGRLPSPSRPNRRHAPAAWSARTVCWVLLAVLIACTCVAAGANPETNIPTPDVPTEPPTLPPTEPPTLPPTEPPTLPPTTPPTLPTTTPPTLPPTEPPTPTPTPIIVTPTPTPTPIIVTPTPTPTPTTLPPTTIITSIPTTVPTTNAAAFPPSLVLYPTASPGYAVTVDGSVGPGTAGTTITRINWNWGDGVVEDNPVPNTHTYAGIGSYTITVTAFQSDGQSTTRSMTVFVSGPTEATTVPTTAPPATTQPPVTVLPTATPTAGPPVLSLNPPLVENETVVIGGLVQPGGPGAVIDLVIWDWGDGIRETQNTLPVTHVYRAAGEYTIGVEAIQSETGAPEKRLTATTSFPVSITQVPATYTTGTPMPNGSGFAFPDIRLFGLNIFPLLVLLLVGLLIGGLIYYKSRESLPPEIPTTDAIEQAAAAYQDARERGDLPAAKQYAFEAARLLVIQAETVPKYGNAYLEKAEIWKEIAQTIDDQPAGPVAEPADMPAPVTLGALVGTAAGGEADSAGETGNGRGELLAGTDIEPGVFDAVLRIALEIAREGREGKPVGTAFLVGDVDGVLAYSTQFILNPFKGHTAEERLITNEELAENIKEFALLDGAFVIGSDGVVEAAGRYITVETSAVQIPAGLGSRHASVAGITLVTTTIGIVVSQSGGLIKIFKQGEIVRTVSPW